jgi:hypothetical protein
MKTDASSIGAAAGANTKGEKMISDVLSDAVDEIESYQSDDVMGEVYRDIAHELFFVKKAMDYVRLLEGLDTPPTADSAQRRLYRTQDKARLLELQGLVGSLLSTVERDLSPEA